MKYIKFYFCYPRLMWFERVFLWLSIVERYVLLPALFLDVLTHDSPILVAKFGLPFGVLLAVVCGTKAIRASLTNPSSQYLIVIFAKLLFRFDFGKSLASRGYSETFLVDYAFVSFLLAKTTELILKIQFIITYIAPWQSICCLLIDIYISVTYLITSYLRSYLGVGFSRLCATL